MKLLLDTHAVVFALAQPESLGAKTRRLLQNAATERWVSVVSLWEIAVKVQVGKLDLPRDGDFYTKHLGDLQAKILPVQAQHVLALFGLPLYHRDPFDRLLLAQAKVEGLMFVTRDRAISQYGLETIW